MATFHNFPTDAAWWWNFNANFVRHAEAMFVYMLPGWKESKGVRLEIGVARQLNIPTAYWNEDFSPYTETEH